VARAGTRYETIRPSICSSEIRWPSVPERGASERGASERTLYRRVDRFQAEGTESLFDTQSAKRRELPPAIRTRLIVDLKAEYPAFNLNEIANIVYVPASAGVRTTARSGGSSGRNPGR
jgi:hypothetical protein